MPRGNEAVTNRLHYFDAHKYESLQNRKLHRVADFYFLDLGPKSDLSSARQR